MLKLAKQTVHRLPPAIIPSALGLEEPGLIAEELSAVATEALGYKMIVHHETMVPDQMQNTCAYSRAEIVSNHQFQYESKEQFDATLDALAAAISLFRVHDKDGDRCSGRARVLAEFWPH